METTQSLTHAEPAGHVVPHAFEDTLTRDEAARGRTSAWDRYQEAKRDRDSWANVISEHAVRGRPLACGDDYIAARAAAVEAHADWQDARERCGLVAA